MIAALVLAAIFLFAATGEASAEPVSFAIGLTALLEGTALAGFGGTILGIGASLALSAASLALQKSQPDLKGGQGVDSIDQGLRQPTVGPVPLQRLALGTVTTSGALFFRRSAPPYLWRGFLLAAHKCGAMEQFILNGVPVSLDGDGLVNSEPFYDGTNRYLEVSYRDGDDDQAIDPIIARDSPTMPTTFRQRGTTTLVIKAHWGTSEAHHKQLYGSNSVFNPLCRFGGAFYYDPRKPGCLLDDETTWVQGSNATLNTMRALTFPWPDMRLLDPGKVNWDRVAEAADIDDKWTGRKDGTVERNHTVNGVILSSRDPLQMLRELLTSCDGLFVLDGGKYFVMPGAKRDPVATLTQDMLAGGFELHTETPDRDLINTVKTEFVAPDREYKPSVGPILTRADLVTLDGQPLETTLSLPFTEGAPRAQRLANRKLVESRGPGGAESRRRAFSAAFRADAIRKREAGDVVNLWFRDAAKVNGIYQIRKIERDLNADVGSVSMVEYDKARFDWYAPTQEQDFDIDQDVLDAEAA